MIAWDTETRSLRWWENPAFLATWDTGEGGQLAVLPGHGLGDHPIVGREAIRPLGDGSGHRMDAFAWQEFKRRLQDERHHVGAHTKFDAHMAREALGVDIFRPGNRVDDIQMKSRLLFGQRRVGRHDLESLGDDLLPDAGKGAAKAKMEARHKQLTGTSDMKSDDAYYRVWKAFPADVEYYARKDAEDTRALDAVLDPMLRADAKLWRLYEEVERPVQEVIYRAEQTGVHVDPSAVERLRKQYQADHARAAGNLEAALGFVPEGEGSAEALREGLIRAGVELTEYTEGSEDKEPVLAVNKQALNKHADHPAVQALFEWRRTGKFLSTYIEPLVDKEIVHATFGQADAWTGRMASQQPNMQNLPKRTEVGKDANMKMRSVFIPAPGMEFIIADFESIEVFQLAYWLGNDEYKDLVQNGDPHARTAAVIWGGRWENYTKQTPNRWLRDIAKQVTYTIIYGGGKRVIAETINKYMLDAGRFDMMVDEDQAGAIRRKVTNNIPGYRALTDTPAPWAPDQKGRIWQQLNDSRIVETLKNGEERHYGYIRTLMGRKQWIQMWPEDKAYVGLSGLIQGSAADIMKAAAVNVFEALKPFGGQPILFVHDELVAQVPLGEGKHILPTMVEAMEAAGAVDPPISVEANITARSYAHVD